MNTVAQIHLDSVHFHSLYLGKKAKLLDFMRFGIDSSQHGLTPTTRQMTIFYGGQAHVFDDVHPNKV
jgi:hypothetical protein